MDHPVVIRFRQLKLTEKKLINIWKKLGKAFPELSQSQLKALCTKERLGI